MKFKNCTDGAFMVSWVPYDPKVKLKSLVEFRDLTDLWEVVEIYGTLHSHDIKRKWNVGGL